MNRPLPTLRTAVARRRSPWLASKHGIAFLTLSLLAAGCGQTREVKVIKLAHGLDPQHSVHKGMVHLGDRLAEKSGGTMRVDVYASGQLGSERECLELVQIGGLAMTKVSASVLEGFAPEFKVFGLPYLFRDDAHKTAVLAGPIGKEILAAPESKFMRGLCYYDSGSRSFYTKSRPVRTPDDLKGLKIRVQESPMAFALIRAFGASATPISFGELYTSLQQGVVDGAENNPPSFHLARHYEVCKYYSLDEHTSVPDVVVVSTHFWKSLTPQQQNWLQEAADESAVYQHQLWGESTTTSLAAVEKAGVEIIRPDKALFAARVADLHEQARQDPIVGPLDRRIAEVRP
jgi:tripartite ATP-independent transporter DctP family solute receptor